MQPLNLPEQLIKTRINALGKREVFDTNRKKYLLLTPEEWVRQQFIAFLIHHKNFPASLIAIEKGLKVNQLQKRFDAVVFDRNRIPLMLIEFKAPQISITEKTFSQIAAYNLKMKVKYLTVSNGLKHYCCQMDYEKNSFQFLSDIPDFKTMS